MNVDESVSRPALPAGIGKVVTLLEPANVAPYPSKPYIVSRTTNAREYIRLTLEHVVVELCVRMLYLGIATSQTRVTRMLAPDDPWLRGLSVGAFHDALAGERHRFLKDVAVAALCRLRVPLLLPRACRVVGSPEAAADFAFWDHMHDRWLVEVVATPSAVKPGKASLNSTWLLYALDGLDSASSRHVVDELREGRAYGAMFVTPRRDRHPDETPNLLVSDDDRVFRLEPGPEDAPLVVR